MAAARAVDEYREDLSTFLDALARDGSDDDGRSVTVPDADGDPADRVASARGALERLRDGTKRVEALGGDVAPETADALVEAANALGDYVRTGDDASLDRARERIDETGS
jgi:cytosine/adenosine deaminase-related metal-dependent hydrolase